MSYIYKIIYLQKTHKLTKSSLSNWWALTKYEVQGKIAANQPSSFLRGLELSKG